MRKDYDPGLFSFRKGNKFGDNGIEPPVPSRLRSAPELNPIKHVRTSNTVFIQIFVGGLRHRGRCVVRFGAESKAVADAAR